MGTQRFVWKSEDKYLGVLEVRHAKYEMMLVVHQSVAQQVREKMQELNKEGMYPNEETTSSQGSFAKFIVSSPDNWNCKWRDLRTILDQLLEVHSYELI